MSVHPKMFDVWSVNCLKSTVFSGLKTLLNSVTGYIESAFNNGFTIVIYVLTTEIPKIIKYFSKSCQSSQLVNHTASCIMDMVESVTRMHNELNSQDEFCPELHQILSNIDELISVNHTNMIATSLVYTEITGVHSALCSPLYKELVSRFDERLKELEHLQHLFVGEKMVNIAYMIRR